MVTGAGAEAGAPSASSARPVRLRPLTVPEMLDAAIKVYRSRPRDMIVAAVVVTLPAVVLQVLVQMSAGNPQALTETDEATGVLTVDATGFAVYLGGTLVSTLLLLLANNLAVAGTTRLSLAAYLGDETSWRESLRFAFRRFWPLTGVLALTTLGLVGGFLLCIVPGFWLQGIWAVAVPALLVEDLGAVASLGRSHRLVRGRFWPVLGAIVLGGLLVSVLQGILVAPVIALQLVEASFVLTSLLTGVAQLISAAVTTPLMAAIAAVVYVDLRVRKEGFDLELMARGVGVDPTGLPDDGGRSSIAPVALAPAPPVAPVGPVAPHGGWGRPAGAGPGTAAEDG